MFNESDITFETHELRLTSDQEQRFRWIVGAFYMKNETAYDSQWSVPPINPGAAVRDDLYFETDQVRMDSETAFFGEFSYDITDQLTATVGLRDFDSETTLEGFVGTVGWPNCCFYFSDSRPPDNVNSKFEGSDNTFKVNIAYTLNDDVLIYGTVSEGYRPGGANRTEQVGATYDADFVTSYELGVKSTLSDGRIRLNAAMYTMDWDDMQLGFFNPDISLLGLVDNVGTAESQGFELDATWLATEQLEINMSYAYNKAELTEDYDRRNDGTPDAFTGQDLPFTPDTKWALTARYNFDWMGGDGYLMSNTTFTDSMYNGIFLNSREEMDSYTISQVSLGLARDQWTAELFASNVFDEEAELYINTADIKRLVTVNRPRTIGFRFGMRFE
ncbi:MAG: TonB-dependent receptor [Proteobacteria bacterium]|nr:TonB-dependent receptor [Pseudomonadota bacterium]